MHIYITDNALFWFFGSCHLLIPSKIERKGFRPSAGVIRFYILRDIGRTKNTNIRTNCLFPLASRLQQGSDHHENTLGKIRLLSSSDQIANLLNLSSHISNCRLFGNEKTFDRPLEQLSAAYSRFAVSDRWIFEGLALFYRVFAA